MKDLVVGHVVHVGAETADFKLVGIRAAHMEANHLSRGDAQSVRIGVDPVEFLLSVRGNRIRRECAWVLLGSVLVARSGGDDLRRSYRGSCGSQELAPG